MLRPDRAWCADITYIHLHTGFVYVAIVLDAQARAIRGTSESEVYLSEYRSLAEAQEWVDRFTEDVYNRRRICTLLGYDTPPKYEQQWQ